MPLTRSRRAGAPACTATLLLALLLAACSGGDDGGTAPTPVTVSVAPSTLALEVDERARLTATVSGAPGATVSWTSSNGGVARVDATGEVTGVAAGTAVVTASVQGTPGATASAAVTVTEPPLAITLDGFSRDGQPIAADALSGVVTARVTLDAPAAFQGRIEIVIGGRILGTLEVAPPATALPGLQDMVERIFGGSASVRSERLVSVNTVQVVDAETLEPAMASGRDLEAIARLVPGQGAPVESGSRTVRGDNPDILYIRGVTFTRGSLTSEDNTRWGAGEVSATAGILRFDPDLPSLAEIERIDVLRGAQGTQIGGSAANGLVNLVLREDRPFAQGGVSDLEGELRWGTEATVRLGDGSTITLPVANGNPLFGDFAGGFHVDNLGPRLPDLTLSGPLWLGTDLPGQFSALGLRWEEDANGPATVEDFGIGQVEAKLYGGFTPSLELGEYLDTSPLAETGPALYLEWAISDALGNLSRWQPRTSGGDWLLAGVDRTAPAAPTFRLGATYTRDRAINPGNLNIAWDVQDIPGGGGVTSGISDEYRLSGSWRRPSEAGCFLGTPNGPDCLAFAVGGGVENGYVPDLTGFGNGEFTLSVGALDGALNPGPFASFHFLRDDVAPVFTGTPTLSTPLSGRVTVGGVSATDDLELRGFLHFGQYVGPGLPPLTLGEATEDLGTAFDGSFRTEATASAEVDWIRSIETTAPSFPYTPTGVLYQPTGWLVSGLDTGWNSAFVQSTVTGNQPRTGSFLVGGMDSFGIIGGGSICNPATTTGTCGSTPTRVTLRMEAFTTGQFEVRDVRFFRLVPSASGTRTGTPFTGWLPIQVIDRGGFREAQATFQLDAGLEGLVPGDLDVFALGRDESGGAVMTNLVRYQVR